MWLSGGVGQEIQIEHVIVAIGVDSEKLFSVYILFGEPDLHSNFEANLEPPRPLRQIRHQRRDFFSRR